MYSTGPIKCEGFNTAEKLHRREIMEDQKLPKTETKQD